MGMIQEPVLCADQGFFGPESISWRVTGPTMVPALVATGVMFFLSPQNTAIGMQNTTGVTNPWDRVVQTADYTYAIVYGDRATASRAAAVVNAIHDRVRGTWAPTGERIHEASEPHNLLWLLIPFTNAMLDAYDAYGPRNLTADERDRFWRDEVTVIGELNRIPLDMMPTSQTEADDYLESQRPLLAVTEPALAALDLLFPSLLAADGPIPRLAVIPTRLLAAAGIALLPDHAVRLMVRQPYPGVVKWAIRAGSRPLYASMSITPGLKDILPRLLSPASRAVVAKARASARTGVYDEPRPQPVARQRVPTSVRSRTSNGTVAEPV